ncbi:MAG: MBL fold metallo-hydrolase [Actinomycetota bacterium]|nr:MBL fold metallo-hydrolase [Actinomycetota bacterium]
MSTQHTHHGHSVDDAALDPPRLEEVADGAFAYVQPDGTWFINNTGFVAADDGVIAIDTCATERRTRAFLDTIGTVTSAPMRLLVNTHHHGDHTHGNHLTHPAAIVGHERCRELMLAWGISHLEGVFEQPEWGNLELAPPMVTFDDRLDLWAGDTKIELHYIGTPAHTTNDIVAWLPTQRVLYAGDLVFNGGTPFVVMGSVAGALESIERLRAFDASVIVPGHGPVCDPAALDRLARYYRFVQDTAAEAERAGVSPLDAARDLDLGEFAELTDPERIVGNLHRALYELRGGERGGPMDIVAAIGDMVTYNGGKPLRCVA